MNNFLVFVGKVPPLVLRELEADFAPLGIGGFRWLKLDDVCEYQLESCPDRVFLDHVRQGLSDYKVDVFFVSGLERRKKLLLADMDATIVTGETLDDLADLAGLGAEISSITKAAMRGELDFEQALCARVSKLKGLSESLLYDAFSNMAFSDGALTLIGMMRAQGSLCVLVSGGFTFFTSRVAEMCGFSFHHGNGLDIQNGVLSGEVLLPILDKNAKLAYLNSYVKDLGLDLSQAMTVGDGANDLPMLLAAGLGVGYRPKPLVREQVLNSIIYSDLTSLLYMQGYSYDDILPYMKN
ncbi:MAG TPA: phosphoserine phosphatase SerB [Alphaproteobacteria bacterium]|nr:phosphoserine phosphatase SerB [Alphaproteobacteria bacterium]HRK98605.1 phosphoserine phosphatase SerB [Alphaproteobacteria bacterium]